MTAQAAVSAFFGALAVVLNITSVTDKTWSSIALYVAVGVAYAGTVLTRYVTPNQDVIEENSRAIAELESRRARLSVLREMDLEEMFRSKG
jgi:hypothetical protein